MPILGNKPIGTVAYLGGLMAVPEAFCWAWGQMVQLNTEYLCEPGEHVHYDRATFSFHSYARNSLVDRMQGDWLLMLDTDHVFEPDLVVRMVHRMHLYEVDVLTGLYLHKSPPHTPVLYTMKDGGIVPIADWDRQVDLMEVGSAGGGCLLVKRDVYRRVREELNEGPFDIELPYGEDHSFFRRLDKLGIKAYCCPTIECKHLRFAPVGLADYSTETLDVGERYEVEGRVL